MCDTCIVNLILWKNRVAKSKKKIKYKIQKLKNIFTLNRWSVFNKCELR